MCIEPAGESFEVKEDLEVRGRRCADMQTGPSDECLDSFQVVKAPGVLQFVLVTYHLYCRGVIRE